MNNRKEALLVELHDAKTTIYGVDIWEEGRVSPFTHYPDIDLDPPGQSFTTTEHVSRGDWNLGWLDKGNSVVAQIERYRVAPDRVRIFVDNLDTYFLELSLVAHEGTEDAYTDKITYSGSYSIVWMGDRSS